MNTTYVGVVSKLDNGDLSFKKVQISKEFTDVIANLKAMRDNPNRTLLDMQNEFTRNLQVKNYYYLCLPYSYSSSYLEGTKYPSLLSFDVYQKKIEELQKGLQKEDYSNNSIQRRVEEFKQHLKNNFYHQCFDYIQAYNFSKTVSLIKSQNDTVMYSTENIGWTTYNYPVNNDVVISIYTNFGYGNSSYFFLGLKYKNIDILPYASIVHYYKANIKELRRHTRQYTLKRDSWNTAFDFVVNVTNLAKNKPEEFIQKWIINEVNEMISGLKRINENTESEMLRFINNYENPIPNGFYYTVRNVSGSEKEDFAVLKNEMQIALKAEKITGALLMLDKLSELASIAPQIQDAINTIKLLNIELLPEIEKNIGFIQTDIHRLNIELEQRRKEERDIDEMLKPLQDELEKLLENKTDSERSQIRETFVTIHPEILEYRKQKGIIQEMINKLNMSLFKRQNFVSLLSECINNINTYVAA